MFPAPSWGCACPTSCLRRTPRWSSTGPAAGHVPGAVSAPGGQLVQATDQYVGTFNARIVLVDDLDVRAVMTASWLVQMGWNDVFVLTVEGTESGCTAAPVLGDRAKPDAQ